MRGQKGLVIVDDGIGENVTDLRARVGTGEGRDPGCEPRVEKCSCKCWGWEGKESMPSASLGSDGRGMAGDAWCRIAGRCEKQSRCWRWCGRLRGCRRSRRGAAGEVCLMLRNAADQFVVALLQRGAVLVERNERKGDVEKARVHPIVV